jgi:recombination protein RecA
VGRKKKEEVSESTGNSKLMAVEAALGSIRQSFGNDAIMFGNKDVIPNIVFKSSGCFSLNRALGGGWGEGRIVEVYGKESSGKTTICLHAIAEAQKRGELCVFIDVEHAFDPSYAAALGVQLDNLIISQPSSGEEALQIANKLLGVTELIVIDSVAALLPQAEIDKEIGERTVGSQASLMSQAMRKLCGRAYQGKTTLMFINQIRMKIGVMFGSPECVSPDTQVKWRKMKES